MPKNGVRTVLEISLVSRVSPEMEEQRRETILGIPRPHRRMGALVLHRFALRYPEMATRIVQSQVLPDGYEYVGSGAESIVYKKDDEVVKLLRGTQKLSETERQKFAERRQKEHDQMKAYLGDYVLDQTSSVVPHPFNPEQRVVQDRQAYCEYAFLPLFDTKNATVKTGVLERVCDTYPGFQDELGDFAERSLRLNADKRLIPDLMGLNNAVVRPEMPRLTILDGQPVTLRFAPALDHVQLMLTRLQDSIADLAA